MWSEILKFIPKVDFAALEKMARNLNTRFTRVAKRFGRGLKTAFKFGMLGVAGGLGSALIAKVLNPLKQAEEILNRILGKSGQLTDFAEEFETDPGSLARFQSLAEAKGMEPERVYRMMQRFQTALAQEKEAAKGPDYTPGTLAEFTGETDIADALYKFILSMQKLEKNQQTIVRREIFGDRLPMEAAPLFNIADDERKDILNRLPSSVAFARAIKQANDIGGEKSIVDTVTTANDFVTKSGIIAVNGSDIIKALNDSRQKTLEKENNDLRKIEDAAILSTAMQEATNELEKMTTTILEKTAPALISGIENLTETIKILAPVVGGGANLVSKGMSMGVEGLVKGINRTNQLLDKVIESRPFKYGPTFRP